MAKHNVKNAHSGIGTRSPAITHQAKGRPQTPPVSAPIPTARMPGAWRFASAVARLTPKPPTRPARYIAATLFSAGPSVANQCAIR